MENNINDERVLAFSLATEIDTDEMEQVSGGTMGVRTWVGSNETTMGGADKIRDATPD